MKIAVVTPLSATGEVGGAESFYRGLVRALRGAGHTVDPIEVISDESSFERILESYLACYDLDLRAYELVISTKAPSYMVRHPNHVAYLLHTMRVFYDLFEHEYGAGTAEQHRQRRMVQALDRHGLDPGRVRACFTIGHTPYERLCVADERWKRGRFEVLHPAPEIERFREPRGNEYILVPGRLHRWKRVDLVIRAFRRLERDVRLVIVGTGEDAGSLRALAAGDPRIEFRGRVRTEELLDLYAGALVVPFVPLSEDYGLVTIEAFRSQKPVITCSDSGEPTHLVRDGVSGFVVPPDPDAICRKLTELVDHPERAAEMGRNGHESVADISWPHIVSRLLAPTVSRNVALPPLRVLVTDNQPIEPPVGGGRLRLLGLYGTLRDGIDVTYVGSYDWPGPKRRILRLSQRLREIDIPLTDEHFALSRQVDDALGGKTTIDLTMPWLVPYSPELVDTLRAHIRRAKVAIFSHPWMYRCVREVVRQAELPIVYDAHNCEFLLRRALLGDSGLARVLAEGVRAVEEQLCIDSRLVLACSEEDRRAFVEQYGIAAEKVALVPNGVDVESIRPATPDQKVDARRALSVTGLVAVFVGSAYPPNVAAVRALVERIAPACPEVTFLVVGGASAAVPSRAANVRMLGAVDDGARNQAYAAADVALNPMSEGSGVNIKMLDYFAAGLATVSTAVGARGIDPSAEPAFVMTEVENFPAWIERLRRSPELRQRLAATARQLAERQFAWRTISERLGDLVLDLAGGTVGPRLPTISVVVPTFDRPSLLVRLLDRLRRQTFGGFEVVVVDQSPRPLDSAVLRAGLDLRYVHTERKGAVRARNLALRHARGSIVAFTDDDCLPADDWLERGRTYFRDTDVVGVEGRVESDQTDDRRYRIVSNVGFEGLGFMTANLFVRRDVMEQLGGFDERFDDPHFREDTDLGWRALAYGRIPFARDVRVLHPAAARNEARESSEERAAFFVQDALLFHKHPRRYVELLRSEGHHEKNPAFWEHFRAGILRHRVSIPVGMLRPLASPESLAMLESLTRTIAEDIRPT